MTQSLKFLIDANSDQAVAQIQKAVDAVFGLGNTTLTVNKDAADSYRKVQAATDALAGATAAASDRIRAAYDQQRAALDPLYASSQRYASVLQTVDAALDAQIISQTEANRVLALAESRYLSVDRAAGVAGAQAQQMGGSSRNMGFMVQNAAFQVSDFAVQVGMGTSAMRAAGQQLPQLLGGFGVWGAVIGGAVAVLGALIPALLNTGNGAKDAADKLAALDTALSDYISYAKTATDSTSTLQGQFGQFADQIRQHAQFLANVQVANATRDISSSAATFSVALDGVTQKQNNATDALLAWSKASDQFKRGIMDDGAAVLAFKDAMDVANADFNASAQALGLTTTQAYNLRRALDALKTDNGGGMAEIHSDAAAVNALLIDMTANGQKISPELAALADKMFALEKSSAEALDPQKEMPKALGDASTNASSLSDWLAASWSAADGIASADIAGGISQALGPAQALAGYLAAAATSAWDAAGARRTAMDPTSPGYLANQYGQYGAGHAAMDSATDPLYNPPPVPVVTTSSGGGGGNDPSNPVADLGKSGTDALKAMDVAIAGVNEKVSLGLISTAEGASAITDAKDKAAAALADLLPQIEALGTPAAQAFANSWRTKIKDMTDGISVAGRALSKSLSDDFDTSFASFLAGTASGKDAFKSFTDSVLNDLAKMASKQFTSGFITPLFDGIVGGLGFGAPATPGATPAADPNAKGGVYATEFFAKGGMPLPSLRAYGNSIVDKPTFFSLGGARRGVMGEAGAEAILPLSRGRDGKLGVATGGAGGVQVNVKVEGVPAGHTARVEKNGGAGDQSIRIIIEQVENAIASKIGSGQSAIGAVMADTYGLNRKPR